MLHGRTPTVEERAYMGKVAQLSCIACAKFHNEPSSPAEIHHTNGKVRPNAHFEVIPLCPKHHRQPDTQRPARWISIHGNSRNTFEGRYSCKVRQLVDETALNVMVLDEMTV